MKLFSFLFLYVKLYSGGFMEGNINSAIRFYLLATKLKYKIRSGWDKNHWNINNERIESIAEHVYGTCVLAISLNSEFGLNMDMEKVNFTESAIHTDSVVMFTDNITDPNTINLYPFVIDLNTLYREHGSKICFFNLNPITDSSVEFISLDDNSTVLLDTKKITQNTTNLSELFLSEENIVTYNIDNVIDTFAQMQQCLLEESYVDFGDL